MITRFVDILRNKKTQDSISAAIVGANGTVILIVHPLLSPLDEYPIAYKTSIQKIINQRKILVFVLVEAQDRDLTTTFLLERDSPNNKIIIVPTYDYAPIPLVEVLKAISKEEYLLLQERIDKKLKGSDRDEELSTMLFVEMLVKLGVLKIFIGGSFGKLHKGALPRLKSEEDLEYGCIRAAVEAIKKYSKIEVVAMPRALCG